MTVQANQGFGVSVFTTGSGSGGGSTTPGGGTSTVQYNNAGSFAGAAGITTDGTSLTVSGSSAGNLVRITQTGAGNALVVEDSANPDASPFVVAADGSVGVGTSSPASRFDVATNGYGAIHVTDTSNSRIAYLGFGAGEVYFGGTGASNIKIQSGGVDRVFVSSSGSVGIGTSSLDASAALDVTSTTGGILFPRMTGTQRDAIASPANGLVLYNTTTDKLQVRAAGSWVDLH
jgi:hypothetical protein